MTGPGRSGAPAPSGSRPSDRASKAVSPVPASIPNAGFTPGPWVWVNDDEIEQIEHPFASVAEVVRIHKDEDRAQRNANARLIAAAPELYEALIEARAEIARLYAADDLDCAATIGEAALRRARGETP